MFFFLKNLYHVVILIDHVLKVGLLIMNANNGGAFIANTCYSFLFDARKWTKFVFAYYQERFVYLSALDELYYAMSQFNNSNPFKYNITQRRHVSS